MREKKGITFGGARPVICVPVIEQSAEAVIARVKDLSAGGGAMIEWRMDWFEQAADFAAVEGLLMELAGFLEKTLLLCTYRTKQQGGEGTLAGADYEALNLAAARSGVADLVDLEFYQVQDPGRQIQMLQEAGVWVVCSNHDFEKTPGQSKMEQQLLEMLTAGADFAKLAVMPQKKADVLNLMAAVLAVKERQPGHIIAMSMGAEGAISRLLGGWYGSEVTFASVGAASAPGQVPCEQALHLLKQLEPYC